MSLTPVEEAMAMILSAAKLLPPENVKLEQAHGRILVKPILARRNQPPFDASAMDGYAVRAQDATAGAILKLAGMSAAGHGFRGSLKPGEAVRILTGAPIPKGADAIVIQENVTRNNGHITVIVSAITTRHIRKRGLDFKSGDILVPAGTKLNARDIALGAAAGSEILSVRRKPRIAIITTGDELVVPGVKPRSDQIYSSNTFALQAMAQTWGADVNNFGIVKDTLKATRAAIAKALKTSDLLITTGGASVGDQDFVQQALKDNGFKMGFWKIAMRPGKPLMFGTRGKVIALGLPGNPVAAMVCARLFVHPLLAIMSGRSIEQPEATAALEVDLPANDERQDYVRATVTHLPDGRRTTKPAAIQDSSMQRTLRDAQALIIRPPLAPAAKAGDVVPLLLLDF
jgi:molybdopterin molybdotransferase